MLPRSKSTFSVVLWSALAVAAVGCSSSSNGSGGGSTPSGADFDEKYAAALCDGAADCCAAGGWYHDAATCKQVKAASYRILWGTSSAKHYDPQAAAACLTAVRAYAESCGSHEPEVCMRVFYGDGKPGDQCSNFGDCARPADGYATCHSGKDICEVHVPALLGQPCGQDEQGHEYRECELDPSLYCDSSTSLCQARLAMGAPCAPDHDLCVTGAYCSATGTCVAQLAAGEPCEVLSSACRYGFCHGTSKTCTNDGPETCFAPP